MTTTITKLVGGAFAVLAIIGVAACGNSEPDGTKNETAATVEANESESPGQAETGTTAGLMPDVTCLDLQAAQDMIQAETELWLSESHDATGQDRMQVMDRNWLVVGQSPAAGTELDEDDIPMLDVVKHGEGSC